jgi:hypothetical protein
MVFASWAIGSREVPPFNEPSLNSMNAAVDAAAERPNEARDRRTPVPFVAARATVGLVVPGAASHCAVTMHDQRAGTGRHSATVTATRRY